MPRARVSDQRDEIVGDLERRIADEARAEYATQAMSAPGGAIEISPLPGKRQVSRHTILWQPVGNPKDKIYRPSTVPRANLHRDYLTKIDLKGRRVFYMASELPEGWKPEKLSIKLKYQCPVCSKKFADVAQFNDGKGGTRPVHGLVMLRDHLRRHGRTGEDIGKAVQKRIEDEGILSETVASLDITDD